MEYSKQFKTGGRVIKKVFQIFGVNILEYNYRPNWRTVYVVSMAIIAQLSLIYSFYHNRNDFLLFLKAAAALPETVQGAFKLYAMYIYRHEFASMFNLVAKIYDLNAHSGPERAQALSRCSMYYSLALKFGFFVLLVVLILIGSKPLYKRQLMFELLIPGLNIEIDTHYTIYIIVQYIELMTSFLGNNALDLLVFTVIIHYSLLTELFLVALKELAHDIEDENSVNWVAMVRNSVKNCAKMHQDIVEYALMLNRALSALFFRLIAVASLSLAVNCFFVVRTNYVDAYAQILLALSRIFMPCLLGTFVEVMTDKVTDGIYEVPWYKLPLDCQKTINLMLLKAQMATKLTIGGISPLNVEVGTQILKAVYSYLMMLLKFS